VGEPCMFFFRLLKKTIKAVTEIATTPPTTPPTTAPILEEEPPDLDEGDDVVVGEWVEAVSEEDRLGVGAGVLIVVPGPASGVSEKEGSVRQPSGGKKKECYYRRRYATHLDSRCPRPGIYSQYATVTTRKMKDE
jgi:hypothetical protein